MSFIKWQKEFLTGLPEVDQQHQKLIETLNLLHFLLSKGKIQEEIREILHFLDNYTVEHFGTEEKLMVQHSGQIPRDLKERHFREHRYFIDRIQEFHGLLEAYQNGEQEKEALLELFEFLCIWLCEHILGTDKETASHLINIQEEASLAPQGL